MWLIAVHCIFHHPYLPSPSIYFARPVVTILRKEALSRKFCFQFDQRYFSYIRTNAKIEGTFCTLYADSFSLFPDCPVFCPCLSYSMISKNVEGDKSYWLLLVPYPPFSILGNRALKLPFCYGFVLKWSIVEIPSHVTSWNSKIEDEEGVQS